MLYALSGLGVNMLNLMMGSYLCSAIIASGFAEKVKPFQTFAGTDLVLIPVWAVFGIIAKIVDGVIDVPMASFADNLRYFSSIARVRVPQVLPLEADELRPIRVRDMSGGMKKPFSHRLKGDNRFALFKTSGLVNDEVAATVETLVGSTVMGSDGAKWPSSP